MKRLSFILTQLLALLVASAAFAASADPGRLCSAVAQVFEEGHFTHRKIDEKLSRQLFKNYVEELDYDHLFFTQKDLAALEANYAGRLGRDVLAGQPGAVFQIFDIYRARVEERVAKVRHWVKENYDFKSERFVEMNREKSPWPRDDAEADRIWRDEIEADLLEEKLNDHAIDAPAATVERRYNEILRDVRAQTRADVLDKFLFVLAQTFDPHSEYLTPDALEELESDMRLSTVGIGVVLQSENGYVKIIDVMNGSPAQRDGRLKVGDRILAIAQENSPFISVTGMKLDKALELIRGKKGSVVKIQIAPAHADTAARRVVEIVRDNIQFKDEEARAELIERTINDGRRERLGWITLPSFYEDMDNNKGRSASRDVRALLTRLKAEKISGLVVDLRQNGGGALDEAVNLTGLFVGKSSPVVQEKDADGKIYVSKTRDAKPLYDGPLVVLTDHLTASASEIFAAAIQDLGRGVVVGSERTFGKGTVQTVIDMRDVLGKKRAAGAGAVQLTIAKFYRIAGGSTQLRGMTPDIQLPSPTDLSGEGEALMKNPLEYDEIKPVAFKKTAPHPLFISELRERSNARVAREMEFAWIVEDLAHERAKKLSNRISLNEETRRAELAADKAREEARRGLRAKRSLPAENAFALTLDNLRKPALERVKRKTKRGDDEPIMDPVRNETLNIVSDLAALTNAPQTLRPLQAARGDISRANQIRRSEPVAAAVR